MPHTPPSNPSAAARALNKIIQDGRFTVTEMASEDLADCSDKHLYNVRSQQTALGHDRMERLSRWLCKHGETRLAQAFIDDSHMIVPREAGSADGSVKDDISDVVIACADVSRAHAAGNRDGMDDAISRLWRKLHDIMAERDRMQGDGMPSNVRVRIPRE